MDSVQLLERLIAFPTVSDRSNLDLVGFVHSYLAERRFDILSVEDQTGAKASLFARLGPADRAGVVLSGHSDVVPVAGQAWTSDPFKLIQRDSRLFGRGTADMKGFVACSLRAADLASKRQLKSPLYISLTHDEEVGCVGVRRLIDRLAGNPPAVSACIVGEPTSMTLGLGHKGKLAARATFYGVGGHSAFAPRFLNAVHLATSFVDALRQRQASLAASPLEDSGYDIPFTTIHVGVIGGGTALNLVPETAFVDFEIRSMASMDPATILSDIVADADRIVTPFRQRFPSAAFKVETVNSYPGFETNENSDVVAFMHDVADSKTHAKLAFGTEGGLFAQKMKFPVVVCGPGSISQAHIADEFIACDQIAACDRMMDRVVAALVQ